MEFERYEDVIDAFERDNMGYDTLTDYIKGENIKIKEIDMSPMKDLKDSLSFKESNFAPVRVDFDEKGNLREGIMATDDAMMMAEGPMRAGADDYRDPMLVEEYEKYRFDMLEQGLEPMSFEQFRREALAGMAKKQPEEVEEIKERKVISLAGGGIPELLEG